ncbi:aminoglycoside 3-N-acetyltransferase [Massilia agri]|uniref:Aminoglycoside N(3)-acetyltransferase n=1 Tax=Massilia agri TaxID=1886785 RepID=A0ABT2ANS4_9BURK|nr:aminoglycoside 3-N-acetyltransferase [Massilia agri]MCS0597899.1 aminoglycoside 3-N-acetyltransferase [Massilia agri]
MSGSRDLERQLSELGLASGDTVMTHVSLRAVGPLGDGPASLLEAILACIGAAGNLMAFVSWRDSPYEETLGWATVPDAVRDSWPAFDPEHAPSYPGFGAFNEFIRKHPDCRRSPHPDASMAAIGPDAAWLVAPHRMGSAYGPGSPLERLLHKGGKVLSIGAGPDAVTVLHYAEAVARIPGKRRVVYSMPLLVDGERRWVTASDWDSNGILDEYAGPEGPDAVERAARDYLALGRHREGMVGRAAARLIDANDIVRFGQAWLEGRHGGGPA